MPFSSCHTALLQCVCIQECMEPSEPAVAGTVTKKLTFAEGRCGDLLFLGLSAANEI